MSSLSVDRTTVGVNPFAVYSDFSLTMVMMLVFFILVQMLANSHGLARLALERRQEEVRKRVYAELGEDAPYLKIIEDGNLQRLRFSDAILFDLGSDELKETGVRVLGKVGHALVGVRDAYSEIQIEGHTDDRPIKTSRFASNWELSSARATAVVRFLQDRGQMDPSAYPLSATGRAEYVPVEGNLEDRDRNRRIEVVLVFSESQP